MSMRSGRLTALLALRASALCRFLALVCFSVLILTLPARAVVVRGVVTDALGKPVAAARVQLI